MIFAALIVSVCVLIATVTVSIVLLHRVSKLDTLTVAAAAPSAACGGTPTKGKAGCDVGQGRPMAAPISANQNSVVADLDLFGRERPTMTVRMPNSGELLHIKMPTKQLADSFAEIGTLMEKYRVGSLREADIDRLFGLSAVILSHNKENEYIHADEIRGTFDADDCADVLVAYMEFITRQLDKNQGN